jgi:hypothetical protein
MVEAEAKYIPHKIHVRDRLLPWIVLKIHVRDCLLPWIVLKIHVRDRGLH